MYFESGGDKVRKSPWITAKFGDFQKEYRFVPLLQKSVIAAAILGSAASVSAAAAPYVDVLVNHEGLVNGLPATQGLAGGEFTYRAKVKLNGGDDATGVTLSQTLPEGTILLSVKPSPSSIKCTLAGGGALPIGKQLDSTNNKFDCAIGSLTEKDGFKWVDFNVVLPEHSTTQWQAVAQASLKNGGTEDLDPSNNKNLPRKFSVYTATDLGVKIAASKTNIQNGDAYDYTINVTSRGPEDIPAAGWANLEFDIPSGAQITGIGQLDPAWDCVFSPSSSFPIASGKMVCKYKGGVSGASYLTPVSLPQITLHAEATMSGPIGATASVSAYSSASATSPMPDAQTSNNVAGVIVTSEGNGYVDMSLAKSVSPSVLDAAAASSLVTYTLTPRREKGDVAPERDIVVTDVLPAGVTFDSFVSSMDKRWTCGYETASRTVSCTWTVPAGQTYFPGGNNYNLPSIKFQANVQTPATDATNAKISNAAEVKLTGQTEPNTANNKATADVTFSNTVMLNVSKSGPTTPVKIGTPFDYTVVVNNQGPMDVLDSKSIVVTEKPGAGLLLTSAPADWTCLPGGFPSNAVQTCTPNNGVVLAKGDSLTLKFGAQVDTQVTGSTDFATYRNDVEAGLGSGGRDTENVSSGSNVTLSNESVTLGVDKTVRSVEKISSSDTPSVPLGAKVTYRLTVTNSSTNSTEIARQVRMEDSLHDLVIATDGVKSGSNYYPQGGLVSFVPETGKPVTCQVDGNENSRTRNLTCLVDTLSPGESTYVDVTIIPRVDVNQWVNGAQQPVDYKNTVTAYSLVINNTPVTDDAVVQMEALTNIDVEKKVGPEIAAAGQVVRYDVTVANRGPSFAENVTLKDVLPANAILVGGVTVGGGNNNGSCVRKADASATVGTTPADGDLGGILECAWTNPLNVGAQYLVTYFARSTSNSAADDVMLNTVDVDTTTPEITKADNHAEAKVTLTRSELDVSVDMLHSNDGLALGEDTVYTVVISNSGKSFATDVLMNLQFPVTQNGMPSTATFEYQGVESITGSHTNPGNGVLDKQGVLGSYPASICNEPAAGATTGALSCTIPVMAPGDTITLTFKMKAKDLPEGATTGTIFHAGTVKPAETEWLSNGQDTAANNVTEDRTSANRNAVDLGIVKTGPTTEVIEGGTVNYTLTVTNYGRGGTALSPQATVTDVLPKGLIYVNASGGDGCSYDGGTRAVTCKVPQMKHQGTTLFALEAKLEVPYTGARPLVNAATVTTPGDGNPTNDTDEETTPVEPAPTVDFGISKAGPAGPLDAGDSATYTLTVTNEGKGGKPYTKGGKVTDVLPEGLEFVSATGGDGCTFTEASRTVSCDVPALDSKATAVFVIDTKLADPYKGARPLVNKASVTLPGDENPKNDEDEASTTIVPPPEAKAVPTLSQWGLIILSSLLGLMALGFGNGVRRRK